MEAKRQQRAIPTGQTKCEMYSLHSREDCWSEEVLRPQPGTNDIFKISKLKRSDNQGVVGDKCVKEDSGNLFIDNKAKKVAWKQH